MSNLTCNVSERCEAITVTRPQNTVGFIGDTVVLQCRTNDSQLIMTWGRDTSGPTIATSSRGVIEKNSRLSLNISVDGQFDLVINSTQSDDAGRYDCTQGFQLSAKAELVLLGRCFISNCHYFTMFFCYAYDM